MFYILKRLWKYGKGTMPITPDRSGDGQSKRQSEKLQREINKPLRRSLHIRHLDSGSSNACEWEMTALLNPVYDIQRFGIDFVASPRHADMLLITGGVTRNLEQAIRRAYAATPHPKWVLAVGDDACGSGFIGRTYAHYGGVDQIIPVNVYVPGDPPTPAAILQGILRAAGRPNLG